MTEITAHPSSRRYPPEIKERAVWMVLETTERTGEQGSAPPESRGGSGGHAGSVGVVRGLASLALPPSSVQHCPQRIQRSPRRSSSLTSVMTR